MDKDKIINLSKKSLNRRTALAFSGTLAMFTGSSVAEILTERIYSTTQLISSIKISQSVIRIVTSGFFKPEDGGAAAWRRVSQQPKHPGYITDATGSIFEIDSDVLFPEMFGALGNNIDDYQAIQRAVTVATLTKRRLEFRGARYSINGELVVPADAEKFVIIGASMTELLQLRDNLSIFLFSGENTHHWQISGFRFAWKRNQTQANRRAYAIRFEADRHGGAGHWNFEISHCILVNGFRGFGQSDDGRDKHGCPIWGAVFRQIHMGLTHTGAAIFLNTFGKTGQPNNRIEKFYARGDSLSEPAIIIKSSDTTVLTSIEFNRGSGCQILLESSSNFIAQGIRFEHVALDPKDAYLIASGGQTNVQISGLSVQSMELTNGSRGTRAIVRATHDARIKMDGFTDMPWRSPSVIRDPDMVNTVAVAEAQGGHITIGFIAPLFDSALTLAREEQGSTVRFSDTENYDFVFQGAGMPVFTKKLVRQRAAIVAFGSFTEGIDQDIMRRLTLLCDGRPVLFRPSDLGSRNVTGGVKILTNALKFHEQQLVLNPGSILSLSLSGFKPSPGECMITVSIIAAGI